MSWECATCTCGPDQLSSAHVDEAEETLLGRARAGDTQAFAELVSLHQAPAFRVAYLLTHSTEDAKDVL